MTMRSVALGLLCGAVLCGVCYFNDSVIRQTSMVRSYLPASLFGMLILTVLVINPLLARCRRRWALSGREIAVILALTLVAGHVPGGGLMHYFTNVLMMPHHLAETRPHWQEHDVLNLAPAPMLADPHTDREEALGAFLRGKGTANRPMPLSGIPWYAWRRTLAFWLPLILVLYAALMGLALVLHRQWSAHERLRYPIAAFASELMPEAGTRWSAVFRRSAFWAGFVPVFGIHMNNYLCAWWPDIFIPVPLNFDFRPLMSWSTVFTAGSPGYALTVPRLYFTAAGFAFFLATDLSLSVALAPFLFTVMVGLFAVHGVAIGGYHMTANVEEFLYAGAYAGVFAMLLYTGRRHYVSTFLKALFLPTRDAGHPSCIWGARVFLVGTALFVFVLVRVGLDWPVALLYAGAVVMMFVVISRIVAETGVFFLHPWHFPGVTLFGFLGIEALGPQGYLIMLLVTTVILLNPRASLMPFVMQGLKLVDLQGGRPGRVAVAGAAALLIAFAVAVPVTLYWQYDKGVTSVSDGWARDWAPKFGINAFVGMKQKYESLHGHPLVDTAQGLGRFAKMKPNGKLVVAFAATAGLVLLFSAARLRFSWWPLHPVMFVVMGAWQTKVLALSFLLGWMVKATACRLGGYRAYERLKPVMIGLIAGEIVAAVLPMIIGAVYYLLTGAPPKAFHVM